jgi:hypothetical protein
MSHSYTTSSEEIMTTKGVYKSRLWRIPGCFLDLFVLMCKLVHARNGQPCLEGI